MMDKKMYTNINVSSPEDIPDKPTVIDDQFIKLVAQFEKYLHQIKVEFDTYDKSYPDYKKQIEFLEKQKELIFNNLDLHFEKVWDIISKLDDSARDFYRKYYVEKFKHLFGEPIEINWHIYSKPLGYPGDYITMNYIFDYNKNNYLGSTSFQRLFNNYTCNVPIARSNIIRKDFFKQKILEVVKLKESPQILSVGSGSMRELIELLREDKIKKNTEIYCLDVEKKALEHVEESVEQISSSNRKHLNISYIHKNVMGLLRQKAHDNLYDFIYVSGLFDYFTDKICLKLLTHMYSLLKKDGLLVICNASLENASHRAYYEFLGGWVMVYRRKEEMLSWAKGLEGVSEIKCEQPAGFLHYLFLSIKKLG